ncbi:sulfhydryl oxidase 1-like [Brachionus plicatilis]|uniref:Sulfhydryl oxidase 1-like n=1 Tax=Brachionus plicatilis TaxID=10195 RepID=A0A3M7PFP3_BRAPC|nr:sulfhydryl oxidase 1-like [Brachionus plicatilis]
MMSIQFVILLLVGEIYKLEAKSFHPGLYQADKHYITILNNDNYRQVLFDQKSDVMYFVEFYAHWCGTCKRYAPAWINLASEAKSWQKVVKFAAMNCGDSQNSPVCGQFEIDMYPTVRLFPVRARFNPPLHGARDFDTDKKSSFLSELLTEIQNSNNPSWPNLKPFKSQNLSEIFGSEEKKKNFAFLILEDDAVIAKKIIMDFSEFLDDFVVRRTSWSENSELMKSLKVDNSSIPGLVVIENINSRIFYRLINRNLNLQNKDTRDILGSLIKEYMQTAPYVNHKIATTTKALVESTKNTEQVAKSVAKMSMQDLETGLHLMIRNEIPHSSIILGEELYALRRWIRTLALVSA